MRVSVTGARPGRPPREPSVVGSGASSPVAGRRGADRLRAAVLFLLLLVVYNANLRYIASFDSLAASLLPFRLLEGHGLTLADPSAIPEVARYSIVKSRDGSFVSLYPVVTPLLVTPLYVPAVLLKRASPQTNADHLRIFMEKLSASVVMALAAALLYLALRRVTRPGVAVLLTVAYGLGTSCWTTGSQALWQQTTAQLLFTAILLGLAQIPGDGTAGGRPGRLALLGLLAGLLTANRPTDAVFSLAVTLVVVARARRRAWPFLATASVVIALLAVYDYHHFGSLRGGYATLDASRGQMLGHNVGGLAGLLGLAFSNRGLFVFSPVLLLVAAHAWRRDVLPGARPLLVAYLASLWLHGTFEDWPAGYGYGPRYAMQGLPILFVAIAPTTAALWRRPWGRAAVALAVGFGIGLQVIGAFYYPRGDSGDARDGLWTVSRSSPVIAATAGPAVPDLLYLLAPGYRQLTLRGPEDARAEYGWVVAPPSRLAIREATRVRVRVRNLGSAAWSSVGGVLGHGGVRLRVRWETADARVLAESWEWLAWRLPAGAEVTRGFQVRAPHERGPATLKVEAVQLHVRAFSETGLAPLAHEVTID
jgi:hypothetical protein